MPAVRAELAKAEAPVLLECAPLVESVVSMHEQMRQACPFASNQDRVISVGDVATIPFEVLLKVSRSGGGRAVSRSSPDTKHKPNPFRHAGSGRGRECVPRSPNADSEPTPDAQCIRHGGVR